MARIIAIANQKGGVGKTTTSINLAACLAEIGKKILLIDIDPQGNTTSGYGYNKNEIEYSVYDLLLGECSVEQVIMKDILENLDMIPSNINLAAAEIELFNEENKEYLLKNAIDSIIEDYDYVIIDCPPSLSMLTINAMCAAEELLVPLQCEFYALEGLTQLLHTVSLVQERLNDNLEIKGIVFTMYDSRNNLSQQVVDNVKEYISDDIITHIIPRNVRLAEAPSYGMPINIYDERSTGADAYRKLAQIISSVES